MGVGVASGGKRGRSVVGPQPTTILPIFTRASKAIANQLNVTHGTKDTPRTKRTENESNHSCMCMQKKTVRSRNCTGTPCKNFEVGQKEMLTSKVSHKINEEITESTCKLEDSVPGCW